MSAPPYYSDASVTVHHGDCLDVLRGLSDASVDAVVTDPPYSLSFMGKHWDAHENPAAFQAWCALWSAECLRVLKPGGHLLAFGGTRTSHRLACAVEDVGFEVRDSIAWLYGSGFPKSLDVSKAIDKAAGEVREVVGSARRSQNRSEGWDRPWMREQREALGGAGMAAHDITAPATDDARTWQGWGTALKPAHEPIVVARKPLVGTVAANVLAHGTGALNVDGCRVGDEPLSAHGGGPSGEHRIYNGDPRRGKGIPPQAPGSNPRTGRWPANVVLDESQAEALDEQSGTLTSPGTYERGTMVENHIYGASNERLTQTGHGDSGGASRFFFVAKADGVNDGRGTHFLPQGADDAPDESKGGASNLPPAPSVSSFLYTAKADASERVRVNGTAHPTVKPLALMRWLVRLVTPPGGTVLEPFAGSGTTVEACILEGFRCVAIEREADYLPLITQRIHRRRDPVEAVRGTGEDGGLFDLLNEETA